MARPREFDETAVLQAAIQCFWSRGYEATSVRDLAEKMGLTGASHVQRLWRQTLALPACLGSLR